ncbi:MAG: ATP-binding protein [Bacteroidota bacterium]
MEKGKIVITGAPGTGKTRLIKALEALGYPCFHEVIRDMTAAAKKETTVKPTGGNPLVFVDDPFQFNKALLEGRKAHFHTASQLQEPFVFFDRGMPDVLAYMDYFGQSYPKAFVTSCEEHRYTHLFILPPWKEIFTTDNERMENFQQASDLHRYLMKTYEELGYLVNVLPKTTVNERVSLVLDTIN